MRDRADVIERLAGRFETHAGALGLEGKVELAYRPRSRAESAEALAEELAERTDGDLERGFTSHGPHRDDLALRRDGRELRSYGSRGQVRLGLLALLLAEREELAAERSAPPLLLLDDVMSELDAARRARLVDVLRAGGQSVITATELAHVPGAEDAGVERVAIAEGRVLQAAAGMRSGWPDEAPWTSPGQPCARRADRRSRPGDAAGRGPARVAGRGRRGVRATHATVPRARRRGHRRVPGSGPRAGARPDVRARRGAPQSGARKARGSALAGTGAKGPVRWPIRACHLWLFCSTFVCD